MPVFLRVVCIYTKLQMCKGEHTALFGCVHCFCLVSPESTVRHTENIPGSLKQHVDWSCRRKCRLGLNTGMQNTITFVLFGCVLSEKAKDYQGLLSCNACEYDTSEPICVLPLIHNTCHPGKTTLLSSVGEDKTKTTKPKNKGKVHERAQSISSMNIKNSLHRFNILLHI